MNADPIKFFKERVEWPIAHIALFFSSFILHFSKMAPRFNFNLFVRLDKFQLLIIFFYLFSSCLRSFSLSNQRPHIAAGAIYIVPLRIGGGTRLKIFEAMAMGKAVVSTTIGAEGLPVTPGHDIVIADEPAEFARSVVDLIRDDAARRRIETAARQLVVERYDWSAVAQDFEHALTRVCAMGAEPSLPRRAGLEATA